MTTTQLEIDNLVELLANATDKLETLAANFGKEYGADVETIESDVNGKELLKG